MAFRRKKSLAYFGLSTLILAVLVYLADFQKFSESIQSAAPLPLAGAVATGTLAFTVLGYTWHRFLNKIDLDTSYPKSFKIFMAGQFMNSITPLGQLGGEPVMAYIIKDTENTKYEKALSAVISADIINTIPYITFMLGGATYLFLFNSLNQTVVRTASITLMITILGGLISYVLWFRSEMLEKLLGGMLKKTANLIGRGEERAKDLEKRVTHLHETFESIGEDPQHLASTAIIAHLFFLFQVTTLFLVMLSLGNQVPLSSLYFVIAISSLANFSPTPGGSGTFEAAMAGILVVFTSLNFTAALTVGILHRLATYWVGLVIGYFSLLSLKKQSLDTKGMQKELKQRSN